MTTIGDQCWELSEILRSRCKPLSNVAARPQGASMLSYWVTLPTDPRTECQTHQLNKYNGKIHRFGASIKSEGKMVIRMSEVSELLQLRKAATF